MDGETIMVSIFDADQPLETRPCRLVRLSNGTRAALWRGLAWPISPEDRIDAAGPAYPLFEAPAAPTSAFGLIDGADEAWLVLDGSVALRDAAARALREAGIEVLRSGPWVGDPVDGVVGSAFIRFVRPPTEDLRARLAEIVGGELSAAPPRPDPAERIKALTVELIEARAALARKPHEATESVSLQVDAAAELDRVRHENAGLLQQVAELHAELAAVQAARPQPGPSRVQDDIARTMAALRPDLAFLRD